LEELVHTTAWDVDHGGPAEQGHSPTRVVEWIQEGVQAIRKEFYTASREEFAYKVDQLLGVNRVPETTYDRNHNVSYQLWVEHPSILPGSAYPHLSVGEAALTVFFDAVMDNKDRHSENWLYNEDGPGHVILIDNEWSSRWNHNMPPDMDDFMYNLTYGKSNKARATVRYSLSSEYRKRLYQVYSNGTLEALAKEYLLPSEWFYMAARITNLLLNWDMYFTEPSWL
jgi:hypothetical protein